MTMPSRKGQLSKGELGMATTKVADGNCRVQRQSLLFWTSRGRAIQCSAESCCWVQVCTVWAVCRLLATISRCHNGHPGINHCHCHRRRRRRRRRQCACFCCSETVPFSAWILLHRTQVVIAYNSRNLSHDVRCCVLSQPFPSLPGSSCLSPYTITNASGHRSPRVQSRDCDRRQTKRMAHPTDSRVVSLWSLWRRRL